MSEAFFSLIQYCPSPVRGEVVNIGAILQSPTLGYAGVKIRPHMDKVLKVLWKDIDAEVIRHFAQAIKTDLHPYNKSIRYTSNDTLFPNAGEVKTRPEYLTKFTRPYSPIKISSPRPVTIEEGDHLRILLENMYNYFIISTQGKSQTVNYTKEKINTIITDSFDREGISYDPESKIKGQYWEHGFDFVVNNQDKKIIQSISFDIRTVSTSVRQVMEFLGATEDIKSIETKQSMQYGLFLQPPVYFNDNKEAFTNSLRAIKDKGKVDIVTIVSDDEPRHAAERLASVVAQGKDLRSA